VLSGAELGPFRVGLHLQDVPVLAQGKVRFIGEKIAAVAAEEPDAVEEALSLIHVDYEELPAVFDPLKAMEPDAPILHEGLTSYTGLPHPPLGTPNVFSHQNYNSGDVNQGLSQADIILEHSFRTQQVHQAYIEPHAAVVAVDGSDRIEIWASCKAPFRAKRQLAKQLNLSMESIRVHTTAVGGDFGGKGSLMDIPICYYLARFTGRPVKMVMNYTEELMAGDPRHPSFVKLKVGLRKDGKLIALEAQVVFDSGAYAGFKPAEIVNLGGATYATNVYHIPSFSIHAYGVYTNSAPGGYMKAPGQPQVIFAVESLMDLVAKRLDMDPLKLRLKNLLTDGAVLPSGRRMEKVRCRETLEAAAKAAGWGKPKSRKRIGRGIAVSFRHTGGSGVANLEMSISPEGDVKVVTAVPDIGTGTHTLLSQIAAEVLTVPSEKIQIVIGDTETFDTDAEPGGSKITAMTGRAMIETAGELLAMMKPFAGSILKCNPEDLKLENGHFTTDQSSKKTVSITEVANAAAEQGHHMHLRKSYKPARSGVAGFFVQCAEVEIDTETGILRINRLVTAHDVGTVINPLSHQGQIDGGIIQGLGFTTMEGMTREDGKVVTLNLGDYKVPCIKDVPELKTVLIEDLVGPGPFAAKSIGESSIVATAAAIANAVDDASGIRIFDLPITAEKIFTALNQEGKALS
jgi:carbon-monoxide dehydrogenase large subunit